jgi:pimeloyl-ACP methyl ester carboxylesterase
VTHQPAPGLDPREQHVRIAGPHEGLDLFLRCLPASGPRGNRSPVLYVHGATFPSALSIAHRFDGRSWRDALCEAGFDVWGLDFQGFGCSDRYPEMAEPPDAHPPLCGAADASRQVAAAVRFILARQEAARVSLIAHSWGCIAAGRFAGDHPDLVDRLVLFAPICCRPPIRSMQPPGGPAWRLVTVEDQWRRFIEDVPAGEAPVLSRDHFAEWGERYLDSDPASRSRDPAAVRIPAGPTSEIVRAWLGDYPWEPELVRAPVAIVRGEWDGLIPDADAAWLFRSLRQSPVKRDVKLSRGTHLMHLEASRFALWQESIAFLQGGDVMTPV